MHLVAEFATVWHNEALSPSWFFVQTNDWLLRQPFVYTSSLKLALRSPVIQSVFLVSTYDARETALRSNCVCKVLNDRRKAVRFCKEVSSNSTLNRSMTSSSVMLHLPLIYSHSKFINIEYRGSPSGVTRFMYNVPRSLYRSLVFQAQQLTPLATKSKGHPLTLLLARELFYLVREPVHLVRELVLLVRKLTKSLPKVREPITSSFEYN